jgi:PAS domain S-box-containing protein
MRNRIRERRTSPTQRSDPAGQGTGSALRRRRLLVRVGLLCAGAAVVIALVVLVAGWVFGMRAARSGLPGLVHMAPISAIAVVVLGTSLLLLATRRDTTTRIIAQVLAGVTTLYGVAVVGEYVFGYDFAIDRLLFPDSLAGMLVGHPGRPAPNTAAGLVLLGLALLALARSGPVFRWSQWLALPVGFLALQALIGYAYAAEPMYRVSAYSPMALHSAVVLLLLASAVLCVTPYTGLVGQLTAEDAGGFVARRLLPVALLVPLLFGFIGLKAVERAVSVEVTVTLIVMGGMLGIAVAVWGSTRALSSMDRRRRAVNTSLRENVTRFRQALEMSPFPVMIHAEDGEVLQLSRAWTELSGYDMADIPTLAAWTQRAYGLRHEAMLEQMQTWYDLPGRLADELEHVIRTKRGDTRIWSFSSGPLGRLADGRRLVISAAVDVTERTRSELELRRTNERLGFLFDATSRLLASEDPGLLVEAVYAELAGLMDLDVYFNYIVEERGGRQVLRLASYAGVTEEAVAPVRWLDYGQAISGTVARRRRRMVVENVQSSDDPLAAVVRGMGVSAYVCHPLIAREELVGTISFGTFRRPSFAADELALLQAVADQVALALERARAYESERDARQAAEQASRAKDQFLAVVSHELRTPLTAVVGYTDLLEADVAGSLSDAHRRWVVRIRESAWSLANVIDDILTFARTHAQQERVRPEPADPAQVAGEALAMVRPEAIRKGLALHASIPAAPYPVLVDASKLRRILLNLLGNAVKFTDEGEVMLDMQMANGSLRFVVTDTGPGIPADFLDRIFDPFIQVDASETRTKSGTGLGLTITRELTKLLEGSVSVRSTPGVGSVFTVDLPAVPAD